MAASAGSAYGTGSEVLSSSSMNYHTHAASRFAVHPLVLDSYDCWGRAVYFLDRQPVRLPENPIAGALGPFDAYGDSDFIFEDMPLPGVAFRPFPDWK